MLSKLVSATILGLFAGVSSSKLRVIHPSDLRDNFMTELDIYGDSEKGTIKSALGNFGTFNHFTTVKGRVHYPTSNFDGCQPFLKTHFNGEHINAGKHKKRHMIIMVDRGNCHFVKKAQHIQDFGGALMIVVDNKTNEDASKLHMADDGKGKSVTIPSFIINNQDGVILKEAIHKVMPKESRRKHNSVIIQADIDLTSKSKDMVRLDLWYTSIYELGMTGVNMLDYQDMSEIFENHVLFRPRSLEKRFVKDGVNANCLKDHLYCVVQPSTQNIVVDMAIQITVDEIVEQNLRELCVHDALNPLFKSHWFRYMHDLINKCLMVTVDGHKRLSALKETCHDEVLQDDKRALYIDMPKYRTCYSEQKRLLNPTYRQENPSLESYLDRDIKLSEKIGHTFHPSVSVNDITFRGDYHDPNNLFKAICKSIIGKPESCREQNFKFKRSQDPDDSIQELYDSENPKHAARAENQYKKYDQRLTGMDRRAQIAEIVLALVIVFIINCMCIASCKMYNKVDRNKRMDQEVKEEVNKYFALASDERQSELTTSNGN